MLVGERLGTIGSRRQNPETGNPDKTQPLVPHTENYEKTESKQTQTNERVSRSVDDVATDPMEVSVRGNPQWVNGEGVNMNDAEQ